MEIRQSRHIWQNLVTNATAEKKGGDGGMKHGAYHYMQKRKERKKGKEKSIDCHTSSKTTPVWKQYYKTLKKLQIFRNER
jgi:hypothetical protein